MVIQLITIITILILLREFGRIYIPATPSCLAPPPTRSLITPGEKKKRGEIYIPEHKNPEIYDNVVIYLYAFIMYTAVYALTTVC